MFVAQKKPNGWTLFFTFGEIACGLWAFVAGLLAWRHGKFFLVLPWYRSPSRPPHPTFSGLDYSKITGFSLTLGYLENKLSGRKNVRQSETEERLHERVGLFFLEFLPSGFIPCLRFRHENRRKETIQSIGQNEVTSHLVFIQYRLDFDNERGNVFPEFQRQGAVVLTVSANSVAQTFWRMSRCVPRTLIRDEWIRLAHLG